MVPKTLQVRDLPDQVHAELARRAALAGKSLSDYVGGVLTAVAARPTLAEWVKRVSEDPAVAGLSSDDIVASIREGRR